MSETSATAIETPAFIRFWTGLCVVLALLVGLAGCGDEGGGPATRFDDGGTMDPDGGTVDPDPDPDPRCECDNGACNVVVDETGTERALCECELGWAGDLCDVCAPGYAGEACDACAPGFAESEALAGLCQPAPCAGVDCSGRGTCYTETTETGVLVARCACDPAFQGDVCELCEPGYEGEDCGTCSAGYTLDGGDCVEDACVEVRCGDHGTCAAGVCRCEEGYTGDDCGSCAAGYVPSGGACVPDGCAELTCDHGSCVVSLAGPVCDCDSGWGGASCDGCLPGYFPRVEAGITTCVNELPVVDRRLMRSYDAAALWTLEADASGNLDRWYERYGTTSLTASDLSFRPRQVVLPPGVQFDGVNDDLWTLGHFLLPADTERYSVFLVVQWDPDGGAQTILDSVIPSRDYAEAYSLVALNGTTLRFQVHDGTSPMADVVTSSAFDASAGRQLVVIERRPFLDGHVLTLSNGTTTTTVEAQNGGIEPAWGHLSRCTEPGPSGDCAMEGSFHEVLVYGGPLDTTERDDIVAYLRAKWSL